MLKIHAVGIVPIVLEHFGFLGSGAIGEHAELALLDSMIVQEKVPIPAHPQRRERRRQRECHDKRQTYE